MCVWVYMRSSLFWVLTQHWFVASYQRSRITCRCYTVGNYQPAPRNIPQTTNLRHETSHKHEDLSLTTVVASNHSWHEACPEGTQPFWISREPVACSWCNLAASQRRPYCASVNSHSPVGLVSRLWDVVDWACVPSDRRIHKSPHFQRLF
jgi:hypothetical protein